MGNISPSTTRTDDGVVLPKRSRISRSPCDMNQPNGSCKESPVASSLHKKRKLDPEYDINQPDGSCEESQDASPCNKKQKLDEEILKEAWKSGTMQFNQHPSNGIRYLVEQNLLKDTPEDIAKFLYEDTHKLSKVAIGQYLGSDKEFNKDVLICFVQQYEFKEMDLVSALKMFLRSFVLPGESQQIDRITETFAKRYCNCNPGIFNSTDTCYVLSFSIVMLNTLLHNPNVKDVDKPSIEKFIKMNKGLDNGQDLPQDLLKSYYDSIKGDPLPRPEDRNVLAEAFFNPDYQGWLLKEGSKHKNWNRRWFVLDDNCLYYFNSQPQDKDEKPKVIIPLINLQIRDGHDPKKPHIFEIFQEVTGMSSPKGTIKSFKVKGTSDAMVTGNHEVYRLQGQNEHDKAVWMKKIKANIHYQSFWNLLQKRRQ